MTDWFIFRSTKIANADTDENRKKLKAKLLEVPPSWREFQNNLSAGVTDYKPDHTQAQNSSKQDSKGARYVIEENDNEVLTAINCALWLRRPLLITGEPGSGKSTLAYVVAHQLDLGDVLVWPINTKSTLKEGLYSYDAIGRLYEMQAQKEKQKKPNSGAKNDYFEDSIKDNIGNFIKLGPLGTALLPSRFPKVLLIDEIDKSDIDLSNDLLHIFEEGYFEIPELARIAGKEPVIEVCPFNNSRVRVRITGGRISCAAFPFIIMTSNGERAFPAPFLRRCIRLNFQLPDYDKLSHIVNSHFKNLTPEEEKKCHNLINLFIENRNNGTLATDQLLHAMYLVLKGNLDVNNDEQFIKIVLKNLENE